MKHESLHELLRYIVAPLVDTPDDIVVTEACEGDNVVLQLKVAQPDIGRVIGRQGRIAKEIRTLLKAAGQRDNQKVDVVILDD